MDPAGGWPFHLIIHGKYSGAEFLDNVKTAFNTSLPSTSLVEIHTERERENILPSIISWQASRASIPNENGVNLNKDPFRFLSLFTREIKLV